MIEFREFYSNKSKAVVRKMVVQEPLENCLLCGGKLYSHILPSREIPPMSYQVCGAASPTDHYFYLAIGLEAEVYLEKESVLVDKEEGI